MPTYIILGRLTFRALKDPDEFEKRDSKCTKMIEEAGARLVSLYYTFGHYDFVAVVEAPSEETMAKILLTIGRFGTVSTHTLTALEPEKIYSIASAML